MDRRERGLRRLAKQYGAKLVGKTGGGHYKIVRVDGTAIYTAVSPSDWRGRRNLEADLAGSSKRPHPRHQSADSTH